MSMVITKEEQALLVQLNAQLTAVRAQEEALLKQIRKLTYKIEAGR